jgi:hypothetical protein
MKIDCIYYTHQEETHNRPVTEHVCVIRQVCLTPEHEACNECDIYKVKERNED